MMDKVDLAYWFPKLKASGVRVPKTAIGHTKCKLFRLLDGKTPDGYDKFIDTLRTVTDALGYPCFLRTGHTSGKHDWKDTCHLRDRKDIAEHVTELVRYSEFASLIGMPTDTWVVREFIPMESSFTAFSGELPVNKERRYFIEDGKILCAHPYWPEECIDGQTREPNWRKLLEKLNSDTPEEKIALEEMALKAAAAFTGDGAWSFDMAWSAKGELYAIDMAPAEVSYHWNGCPIAKRWERFSV